MSAQNEKWLLARYVREERTRRKEGIARTTRLYNYQINVLIALATRELYAQGYNEEVRELVLSLRKVQKQGYFDNDNS